MRGYLYSARLARMQLLSAHFTTVCPVPMKKGSARFPFRAQKALWLFPKSGAGNEARTRDLNLGKVALYQLSYSRKRPAPCIKAGPVMEARAGVEPTYTDLQSMEAPGSLISCGFQKV